jgi:hypothetical protein
MALRAASPQIQTWAALMALERGHAQMQMWAAWTELERPLSSAVPAYGRQNGGNHAETAAAAGVG